MRKELGFHSLPKKTQPTLCSSDRLPKTAQSKIAYQHLQGCPEVSEFKYKNHEQMYVHNMNIDYGRLNRPNQFYLQDSAHQHMFKMTEVDNCLENLDVEDMSTKRVTGISVLTKDNIQERQTEKKNIKKSQFYQIQKTEETRPSTKAKPKNMTIKLSQVKAYEELTKRQSTVKRLHSRIVKMMVGGGKITTKIINYPDNNEYLKLCGLK